jgi:NarL family two-component system response regulator LiaR
MIRVLLVDDHEVVRRGVRFVLGQEPDIEVVGECGDGGAALAEIRSGRPDVVLLDIALPGMDGMAVLAALQEAEYRPAVIMLTSYPSEGRALAAVRAGALSYLPKTSGVERVVEAVRAAAKGGSVLEPEVVGQLVRRARGEDRGADRLASLSPREREVLVSVSRGRSNREIARELALSEETVKSHVSRMLTKLGLQDRTQAAIFGLQQGLVPLGDALPQADS